MRTPFLIPGVSLVFWATLFTASAEDWPQWRHDSGRTGSSPQAIDLDRLQLQWTRALPPLQPAFRDVRLQFDRGYEPIVLGKTLFVASSRDDSLLALDTETGEERWRFFTGGPIRFAPVASEDRVWFGSDDGHFYCLNAEDGTLIWNFQAVPSDRLLLGNRRLISTWPIRGGPVLHENRVYFAAGVWSFEGVFVYALDAKTGEVVWRNDECGYLYGVHPHNAEAYGGLAPQGFLLVNGEELIVPSSSAYPARFDLETGELLEFQLPAAGRKPGGWFVSTGGEPTTSKLGLLPGTEVARKRELLFERSVNQKRHEDKLREEGTTGIRSAIRAGGEPISFEAPILDLPSKTHTMLVADEKLFVVTEGGKIHCFGPQEDAPGSLQTHSPSVREPWNDDLRAKSLLDLTKADHGLALLLGAPSIETLETLVSQSQLNLVVIESSSELVDSTRLALSESDLYGHRIAVRHADPLTCELPPYLADLIISRDSIASAELPRLFNSVRPFGGKLIAPLSEDFAELPAPHGFDLETRDTSAIWTRISLPGSTNYTGDWNQSADELVRAPVGVLWFDDTLGHFKRSPQPKFIDGVMISVDKTWTDASTRTGKVDYRLQPAIFSDVYTGRVLTEEEVPILRQSFADIDQETVQPSQYRPPHQKDDWKPDQPKPGVRQNPLTGEQEPRVFPKSYGCDGGFDYGHLYTMRSGTAAFYDKRTESGTINLSGPRSGCTNSIIPANGVLNVPYFYEGCTCSYPLPTAMALVSMPQTHEQWTSWGEASSESLRGKIRRIGLNFGAPGDRMTEEGTLWLDFPNIGGPSPNLEVEIEPRERVRYLYRHSLFVRNPSKPAWPWVVGSAVIGAESIRISGLKSGSYRVRLFFGELESSNRSFGLTVQGEFVETAFNLAGSSEGIVRTLSTVQVADGILEVLFTGDTTGSSLSGLELTHESAVKKRE